MPVTFPTGVFRVLVDAQWWKLPFSDHTKESVLMPEVTGVSVRKLGEADGVTLDILGMPSRCSRRRQQKVYWCFISAHRAIR